MTEQTVTLGPGESKTISFKAVPTKGKTYQVLVNGLTGTFIAVGKPDIRFSSGSGIVTPSNYRTLRFGARNYGDAGCQEFTVKAGGWQLQNYPDAYDRMQTFQICLGAGESKNVSIIGMFYFGRSGYGDPGEYWPHLFYIDGKFIGSWNDPGDYEGMITCPGYDPYTGYIAPNTPADFSINKHPDCPVSCAAWQGVQLGDYVLSWRKGQLCTESA